MGIHLHFKLTEYVYFKNYFSSSNWDDILLRCCHQIIVKTHENRKVKTFTKQQTRNLSAVLTVRQSDAEGLLDMINMMKTQCRSN